MTAPATALYAALLTPLFIALAVRVIRRRRKARVAIGVGSDPALERAVRVHANFAEYVPLALLLMLLVELSGYPPWVVHLTGIPLVAGRLAHALGVSRTPEDFRLRVAGMVVTLTVLGVLATLLLTAEAGLF